MSFDSKLFDKIRIAPRGPKQAPVRAETTQCEWQGCKHPGTHRAPKGRSREREYWRFCIEHVRAYNQSYNYFSGMSDDAVARYQKDALTGHRPTWKMGANSGTKGRVGAEEAFGETVDPFSVFSELNGRGGWRPGPESNAATDARKVMNAERKALQVLGLEDTATTVEIKVRFKSLVKQHHPDANGGDRSTEDRLIEIIKAYNYLKSIARG
ncbi:DnaJ domain-containing protein [Bradyrhizobium sp. LHD-71]|uniref:J domain-containing protein n=1 Tax=Bradyrhizobium sp. LHD-71 TaxID=3072141 RepID=UPI00280C5213|nr:DnaJ domain-containing protein [Bradyrhizobium sp. LHD-71]MDQ8732084.1 DnaJ domain-containing protein [Bradyrhizobium sp. LHD-71]